MSIRVAYLDCFSGISGDMFLGALVHAGLEVDRLRSELGKLGLEEFRIEARTVWRDALEGVKVDVIVDTKDEPKHRGLSDIKAILVGSGLEPKDKERAITVFTRLAEAEAKVHGCGIEEVHFHEVGAVDAIVDVVGSVVGLRCLGVDEVHASPITMGHGFVDCQHGKMPVPVPASLELLRGCPIVMSDIPGELVTPTGAALVKGLAKRIGHGFSFAPMAVGYGFGTRERKEGPPNALRIVLGEIAEGHEELVVLETNLDDSTGQIVGFLIERALRAGALDAWATPIQMKKSRPGVVFSSLVDCTRVDAVEQLIYAETGTLGVRRHAVSRTRLERVHATVETSLGAVRVKFARGIGSLHRAAPEHDDVARIAEQRNLPYRQVLETIQRELPAWPMIDSNTPSE
jgi:uncharacterized protein (TIGR00299 family) protein